MPPAIRSGGRMGGAAVLYMVLGTLAWSLIPLIVDKGGAKSNPFVFNSLYTLFASVGLAGYLLLRHRTELADREIWAAVSSGARQRHPARHGHPVDIL